MEYFNNTYNIPPIIIFATLFVLGTIVKTCIFRQYKDSSAQTEELFTPLENEVFDSSPLLGSIKERLVNSNKFVENITGRINNLEESYINLSTDLQEAVDIMRLINAIQMDIFRCIPATSEVAIHAQTACGYYYRFLYHHMELAKAFEKPIIDDFLQNDFLLPSIFENSTNSIDVIFTMFFWPSILIVVCIVLVMHSIRK
jgi:hypothetical protein